MPMQQHDEEILNLMLLLDNKLVPSSVFVDFVISRHENMTAALV